MGVVDITNISLLSSRQLEEMTSDQLSKIMLYIHVSNVPVFLNSHLQHQTVPLLQVHREQRRGQVSAEGQRTEKDPTGNRRYTVKCCRSLKSSQDKACNCYCCEFHVSVLECEVGRLDQFSGHIYSMCTQHILSWGGLFWVMKAVSLVEEKYWKFPSGPQRGTFTF